MISYTVKDFATPQLQRLIAKLKRKRPFLVTLGRSLEKLLREYFKIKATQPSKRAAQGWPTQHFWDRRIRNATAFSGADERRATVSISDRAFNLKFYGGTVRPKEKKMLSIPMQAKAYGIWPSSGLIKGLFCLKTAEGLYLVTNQKGRRGKGELNFWYRLVPKAFVPRDPTALPKAAKVAAMLKEATLRFFRTVFKN